MTYIVKKASNKFNAKGRNYNGQWYHSTGEMNYAQELDWRLKAGDIKSWERQVKIDLKVNGKHITNYFVDFKIIHLDDSVEYVEYKGYETVDWKMKWDLFNALLPEIDPGATLTVVKHNKNLFYKNR